MTHSSNVLNAYAVAYPDYDRTPKAVLAAVAISLAMRLSEDDPQRAVALCRDEWRVLHIAKIVRQRPQR